MDPAAGDAQGAGVDTPGSPPRRRGVLAGLGAVEDAFYALAALAVLLFGIAYVVRAANRYGGIALAGCVVVAAVAAGVIVGRDIRRRRWTPVSVGVAITYALCLATVVIADFAGAD